MILSVVRFIVGVSPLHRRSVSAPYTLRLFYGCLTVFSRREDGEETDRHRSWFVLSKIFFSNRNFLCIFAHEFYDAKIA